MFRESFEFLFDSLRISSTIYGEFGKKVILRLNNCFGNILAASSKLRLTTFDPVLDHGKFCSQQIIRNSQVPYSTIGSEEKNCFNGLTTFHNT